MNIDLAAWLPAVVAVIAALASWRNNNANLKAARQTERHKYLIELMKSLQDAFTEYEEYLAAHPGHMDARTESEHEQHARIIGKAIAVCYGAGDFPKNKNWMTIPYDNPEAFDTWAERNKNYLAHIAHARLTKNQVKRPDGSNNNAIGAHEIMQIEKWGEYYTRNRDALTDAILRLSQLIRDLQ